MWFRCPARQTWPFTPRRIMAVLVPSRARTVTVVTTKFLATEHRSPGVNLPRYPADSNAAGFIQRIPIGFRSAQEWLARSGVGRARNGKLYGAVSRRSRRCTPRDDIAGLAKRNLSRRKLLGQPHGGYNPGHGRP